MITKIDNFIKELDVDNSIFYAKTYFNIDFGKDEIKRVLPLIKDSWQDYLDLNKRQLFINRLIVASSIDTTNKVLLIVNKLLKFCPFNI